jgi:hypothetical protein
LYEIQFSHVFCKFFAATNVVAFGATKADPHIPGATATKGGTKQLIPRGWGSLEDKLNAMLTRRNCLTVCNCPAFTSPAISVMSRKIYVNGDMTSITIGTLYHEFVHFLQHSSLYPEFYALGGANVGILEGITEFFTRRVDPAIALERSSGQKYQTYFDNITARVGSGMQARNALIKYCFQGEPYVELGGKKPRL